MKKAGKRRNNNVCMHVCVYACCSRGRGANLVMHTGISSYCNKTKRAAACRMRECFLLLVPIPVVPVVVVSVKRSRRLRRLPIICQPRHTHTEKPCSAHRIAHRPHQPHKQHTTGKGVRRKITEPGRRARTNDSRQPPPPPATVTATPTAHHIPCALESELGHEWPETRTHRCARHKGRSILGTRCSGTPPCDP